ncbi:MAG TPA: PKD domain-containing protein, partial [Arachidicoccus sp.]|nr:PKD domain-containing protein [Arachidicoccus sp.]
MRINTFIFSLIVCFPVLVTAKENAITNQPNTERIRSLPVGKSQGIQLIENKGQWESEIRYKAEIPGGAMFLTDKGFVYNYSSEHDLSEIQELKEAGKSVADAVIHMHAYKVNFLGVQSDVKYLPTDKSSTYNNYFIGNDRSKWAGNVGLYGEVVQQNIYQGIDLAVYSKGESMKYDFVVAPGADPAQIVLSFDGVRPELTKTGDLHIKTSVNEIIEKAPYTYQLIDGKKVAVASAYKLSNGRLSFEFPEGYNKALPLMIDPELVFCTYSGGTGSGSGYYGFSTTYDNAGNAYAGSGVYNTGWPVTVGAFQSNYSSLTGAQIVGINKYNATGTNLIYSTYYGGNSQDLPHAMRVNDQDELVIAGSTTSSTMPFTTGCYDSTLNGMDIFVAHFNSTGTALIGATYIGGSGTECNAFSLSGTDFVSNQNISSPVELNFDDNGNIWVVGNSSSSDFPVTANAQQSTNAGASDGVIFKLNPDCSSLLYSSFLGGSNNDAVFGIQFTSAGNLAVCGMTQSTNFPTTAGVLHSTAPGGSFDGFVSIIDATTGAVLQSTYLGTDNTDQAVQLQVDENDNIYVLGRTMGDYPVSTGVYSVTDGDVFIDKISDDLSSSLLSTRLGKVQGQAYQAYYPDGFLLDMCGNVYVTGLVPTSVFPISSISMPLSANAYQTTPANFWFGVLKPNFTDLLYGSYFGVEQDHSHCGVSRMDPNGVVYHSICNAQQYPFTTPGAWDSTYSGGGQDIVTFKFDFEATGVQSHIVLPPTENDSVCAPYTLQFNNNSTSPYSIEYSWNFNDGTTSTAISPTHVFTNPGIYQVILHAHSDSACIPDDYDTMTITVLQTVLPDITVQDTIVCSPEQSIDLSVTINNPSPNNTILWTPATGIIAGANQATVTV